MHTVNKRFGYNYNRMTPIDMAFYVGIFIGCLLVTLVPYLRKQFVEKSIDGFDFDYIITMLFSFILSMVASLFLFQASVPVSGDHFLVFIEGLKLGIFDNFWVNEVKKVLYTKPE